MTSRKSWMWTLQIWFERGWAIGGIGGIFKIGPIGRIFSDQSDRSDRSDLLSALSFEKLSQRQAEPILHAL